jgi:hypothetical protein
MPEWPRRINEEMRQHLDDEYNSLRGQGVSHEEAMRRLAANKKKPRRTRRALTKRFSLRSWRSPRFFPTSLG